MTRKEKDIHIREYLYVIKKRLWFIVLVTLLMSLAGYYYSNASSTPIYQTSTRVIIGPDAENMQTLIVMVKDPVVMEQVVSNLKLPQSAESLTNQVMAEQLDQSQVINIVVTAASPQEAVKVANATAQIFKNEAARVLEFDDIQILSQAKENTIPINSSNNQLIILAAAAGFAISVGLSFLRDSLDDTIKRASDVEETLGIPVIGIVPNVNKRSARVKKSLRSEAAMRGESVGTVRETGNSDI